MRRLWLLVPLLLAGCSGHDNPVARAAGSYHGRFAIESVDGKADPKAIEAEELRGNLELYLTASKYSLVVKGRHQSFTLAGHWTAEKNRVTATTDAYTFEYPTDEDQKALGLKLVSAEEIREVFGHPFVLVGSPDKRKMTGLKVRMGKLLGRFEFERPIPR